jgi:hypothetical protein
MKVRTTEQLMALAEAERRLGAPLPDRDTIDIRTTAAHRNKWNAPPEAELDTSVRYLLAHRLHEKTPMSWVMWLLSGSSAAQVWSKRGKDKQGNVAGRFKIEDLKRLPVDERQSV